MKSLETTAWLAQELTAPDIAVLDASSHLPMAGRDAAAEFRDAHIPGARFLDLKTLVDPDGEVMAALPTRRQFDTRMSELGLRENSRVVLYDNSAMRTAARAWFIFRLYGVTNVTVLDGGFQKWQAEERPVERGMPTVEPSEYSSASGHGALRDKRDILANLHGGEEQVVDARDNPRFTGKESDFRPEVASGHIPGSYNVPFDTVLNADGTFKSEAGLRAAFRDAGVDPDRPIITSCGSGVTASVLLFALDLLGKPDAALYDGSWSDWGIDPETPKETGPGAAGEAA